MRLATRLLLVPALFCSCLVLASCKNDSGTTVGFSQEGEESDWRTAETKSIQDTGKDRGFDVRYVNALGDQDKQIKSLRAFIAQHVKAIVLAPRVKTGYEPVLRDAKNANIPVVLVDRGVDAPDDLYTQFIASDFIDEGKRAAEWLGQHTGGKGNIVEIEGTAGSDPANERKRGFEDLLKAKYPDLKVIASQDGDFDVSKGKQVMASFLQRFKQEGTKINAVYAHNDNMALGAIQAIEEDKQYQPGKDILVISIDGIHAALQAIIDGKLNCSVECNPLLGPDAFDAVKAAMAGQTVPKRKIEKDELFDSSNVTPELLKQRKY